MKYIVTGGLGVVGSRFVETVVKRGDMATIIDSAEEKRNLWLCDKLCREYGDKVSVLKSRVEHADFSDLLSSHDAVLHAAAHTGIPHSEKDPSDDWISNVDATRNILESMRKSGSKIPVVMLSSVKPYRVHDLPSHSLNDRMWIDGRYANGVDETCLLEPDEPYAASKMAQSALVMAYGRTYDLSVTVLRCSNLYGDAPCHGPRHGWLTWFCICAAVGWPINLQGSGLQTRDMLFSDDVASATLAAIDNMNSLKGNVYNIGGGVPNSISCKQAVDLIKTLSKKNTEVYNSPGRKSEDMIFMTNHSKFTNETGWKPSVNVENGVKRILNWAEANSDDLKKLYEDCL